MRFQHFTQKGSYKIMIDDWQLWFQASKTILVLNRVSKILSFLLCYNFDIQIRKKSWGCLNELLNNNSSNNNKGCQICRIWRSIIPPNQYNERHNYFYMYIYFNTNKSFKRDGAFLGNHSLRHGFCGIIRSFRLDPRFWLLPIMQCIPFSFHVSSSLLSSLPSSSF